MDNERDLISQSALLKHRQAVIIGGKLMEVIPVEAVMSAELIDAEEVQRCGRCPSFSADTPPRGVITIGIRRGYCGYWQGRTDSSQYCSRPHEGADYAD